MKPVPGMRHFKCWDCKIRFSEPTRDCISPSLEACPVCNSENHPIGKEEHPEWPVDDSGNLINGHLYSTKAFVKEVQEEYAKRHR